MPITPKSMFPALNPLQSPDLHFQLPGGHFYLNVPYVPQSFLLPKHKSSFLRNFLYGIFNLSDTWESQALTFSHFQCLNYHQIQHILALSHFSLYSSLLNFSPLHLIVYKTNLPSILLTSSSFSTVSPG